VNALASILNISQSAVSQHLRILKSVGLVNDQRRGYFIHYSVNEKKLHLIRKKFDAVFE
jgi:DNA-binding transcriptional ArsR family regulator